MKLKLNGPVGTKIVGTPQGLIPPHLLQTGSESPHLLLEVFILLPQCGNGGGRVGGGEVDGITEGGDGIGGGRGGDAGGDGGIVGGGGGGAGRDGGIGGGGGGGSGGRGEGGGGFGGGGEGGGGGLSGAEGAEGVFSPHPTANRTLRLAGVSRTSWSLHVGM